MTSTILTQDTVFALLNSEQEFPINFDEAWQWYELSTKGNAKRSFERAEFEQGIDYTLIQLDKRVYGHNGGGSVRYEEIYMTVDCFKTWGMTLTNKKGKEVRRYFIECEKLLKELIKNNPQPQPTPAQQWLWHVRMQQFVNTNAIPQGYWCVYLELTKMVALMEGQGVVLHDYAVPDISVGLCWSKYLKDKGIDSEHKFYSHSYPDTRGCQDARIYPHKLLGVFHEWLETIYRAEKFPKYIRERCSNDDLHKISLLFGVAIKFKQLRAAKH